MVGNISWDRMGRGPGCDGLGGGRAAACSGASMPGAQGKAVRPSGDSPEAVSVLVQSLLG